jgi:hypothetical protein
MGIRERGLRRVAVVTTGLAAASVAGSLAVAAVAHAGTGTHQTVSTGTGSGVSSSDSGGGTGGGLTGDSGFGGRVSGTDRGPQATSGGS